MSERPPDKEMIPNRDDEAETMKDVEKQKLKYEVSQEMGIISKQNYKK
ncbi:MAG: hypothetical protein ABRQ24_05185 [Syntrophomonadaceae bacterium]